MSGRASHKELDITSPHRNHNSYLRSCIVQYSQASRTNMIIYLCARNLIFLILNRIIGAHTKQTQARAAPTEPPKSSGDVPVEFTGHLSSKPTIFSSILEPHSDQDSPKRIPDSPQSPQERPKRSQESARDSHEGQREHKSAPLGRPETSAARSSSKYPLKYTRSH